MDTSPDYKKMCQEAEELRESNTASWLPRQDQLQEIIFEHLAREEPYFERTTKSSQAGRMIREMAEFASVHPFDSIEQIWLAFVMSEVYHKRWDGENWILNKLSLDKSYITNYTKKVADILPLNKRK